MKERTGIEVKIKNIWKVEEKWKTAPGRNGELE